MIVLSEFVVNTAEDSDYLAVNTTSGTRLNTPLRDTPASVSELTPEFLADINANNVLEAVGYTLGFTEEITDNDNAQKENAMAVSARGMPRAAVARSASRNYFIWYLNSDGYNTERISVSRGPNSILFGLGEPGGMINTTTKRPRFRTHYEAGFKFDSEGSVRGTFDAEQKLTKNLGLRLNLLKQDMKTWRELAYDDKESMHLAAAWRPFSATTLNVEYERSTNELLQAQGWSANDKYSGWVDAGSLTWDRTVSSTPRPAGVTSISGSNPYIVLDSDTGVYRNYQSYGAGAAPTTGQKVSDPDIVPYEALIAGRASTTNNDYWTYSAFLEHQFTPNLVAEVAFNKQGDDRIWQRPLRTGEIAIKVDPNVVLPGDKTANPNVGKFYVEDAPRLKPAEREVESLRATIAYKWVPRARWLGHHRWTGFVSSEAVDYTSPDIWMTNTTPMGTTAATRMYTNAGNRINLRTYLDFSGGHRSFAHDPYSILPPTQSFTDPERPSLTGTITPGWFINNIAATKEDTTSYMAAGQSYFWDDRLSLTYGYRKDSLDQTVATEIRDTVTNAVTDWTFGSAETYEGTTKTAGAVFHLASWISVYGNISDNFQPQSALDMYDRNVGNIVGEGKDVGLKFSFLEKRLYGQVGYYQVKAGNRVQSNASQFVGAINSIWQALDKVESQLETDFKDTSDYDGEGVEIELVGKLTRGLSISANFTRSTGEAANIDRRILAYVELNDPEWAAVDQTLTGDGGQTIETSRTHIATELNDDRLAEGVSALGSTKYVLNVVTRYQFQSEALRNWNIGLIYRYRGNTIIGFNSAQEPFYAPSFWLADFNLGYRMKLKRGRTLSLALNVANVFDEDDLVWLRSSSTGQRTHYSFQKPRLATFTTVLAF